MPDFGHVDPYRNCLVMLVKSYQSRMQWWSSKCDQWRWFVCENNLCKNPAEQSVISWLFCCEITLCSSPLWKSWTTFYCFYCVVDALKQKSSTLITCFCYLALDSYSLLRCWNYFHLSNQNAIARFHSSHACNCLAFLQQVSNWWP